MSEIKKRGWEAGNERGWEKRVVREELGVGGTDGRRKMKEEEYEGPESLIEQRACSGKCNFSNLLSVCSFQERPLGQDEIDGNSLSRCPSMLANIAVPSSFCVNSFM